MPIRAISLSCYGTLIDLGTGLRAHVTALLERKGASGREDELLAAFARRREELLEPFRGYQDVLARALERALRDLKLPVAPEDAAGLLERLVALRPFPDVREGLARLFPRYRLAVLSNMDSAVLFEAVARLGAPVHLRVASEEVRAHKPGAAPFQALLRHLGLPAEEVLHVAADGRVDLAAAHALGLRTAWVRRPGAVAAEGIEPAYRAESLLDLADQLLG